VRTWELPKLAEGGVTHHDRRRLVFTPPLSSFESPQYKDPKSFAQSATKVGLVELDEGRRLCALDSVLEPNVQFLRLSARHVEGNPAVAVSRP